MVCKNLILIVDKVIVNLDAVPRHLDVIKKRISQYNVCHIISKEKLAFGLRP